MSNFSIKNVNNDINDLFILKLFDIQTRLGQKKPSSD